MRGTAVLEYNAQCVVHQRRVACINQSNNQRPSRHLDFFFSFASRLRRSFSAFSRSLRSFSRCFSSFFASAFESFASFADDFTGDAGTLVGGGSTRAIIMRWNSARVQYSSRRTLRIVQHPRIESNRNASYIIMTSFDSTRRVRVTFQHQYTVQ